MLKALSFIVTLALPAVSAADPYLLMAEENGCYWCEKWNAEIAHIYPKTVEGRTAPLRRYNLHDETPDVQLQRSVHFTPTFILVDEGREVGRIEGYPGEEFFWGMLSAMLERARIPLDKTG